MCDIDAHGSQVATCRCQLGYCFESVRMGEANLPGAPATGLTDELKATIQNAYSTWLGHRGFKARRGQRQMIADIARGLTEDDRLWRRGGRHGYGQDGGLLPCRHPHRQGPGQARGHFHRDRGIAGTGGASGPARPQGRMRTSTSASRSPRGAVGMSASSASTIGLPTIRSATACSARRRPNTWNSTDGSRRRSTPEPGTAISTTGRTACPRRPGRPSPTTGPDVTVDAAGTTTNARCSAPVPMSPTRTSWSPTTTWC